MPFVHTAYRSAPSVFPNKSMQAPHLGPDGWLPFRDLDRPAARLLIVRRHQQQHRPGGLRRKPALLCRRLKAHIRCPLAPHRCGGIRCSAPARAQAALPSNTAGVMVESSLHHDAHMSESMPHRSNYWQGLQRLTFGLAQQVLAGWARAAAAPPGKRAEPSALPPRP